MAAFIVSAAALWAKIGLGVAAVFLIIGIDRVEPNARRSWVFRPMLIPGIVLIWPLVLWRWAVLELGAADPHTRHQPPRLAHGRIWAVMAVLIPLVLVTSLLIRQDRAALGEPPMQLTEQSQ
ncbi:MAG: hypothetical protein AAGH83_02925 [Pseudomonadota bacterium]